MPSIWHASRLAEIMQHQWQRVYDLITQLCLSIPLEIQ